MKVHIGYAQTRRSGDYETNRYSVEIEDEVWDSEIDDPKVTAARLYAIARQIVKVQKDMDGIE
jgi:hypothetical protein